MRKNLVKAVYIFVVLIIAIQSCKRDPELQQPVTAPDLSLNLKWNKAYATQTPAMVEEGLVWCFSFLGATLPVNSYPKGLQWKSSSIVAIDLSELGFNNTALNAFAALIPQFKASTEYKQTGSVDIGRFVMLTLNSSNHYYKITGAKERYHEFESSFSYDSIKAAFIESSVSKGQRLIRLATGNLVSKWGFVAASGHGSLPDNTFHESEHEVLDIMPNGQFRVAIYDENNELATAADSMYTFAGKPAKCLWCHEVQLKITYDGKTSVPGYYPIDSFQAIIRRKQVVLDGYRSGLSSRLNYTNWRDHTLMELLYISFMEPSAGRLANEWNMSEEQVKNRLVGLQTHLHDEFLYLGDLYYRKDVEQYAPFTGVRPPDHTRELSSYEPDLIP